MHILLENCKETMSGREGEEEKLPMTAMGKAAAMSPLQRRAATQPGPVSEVTHIIWHCLSMHCTNLLKVL